MVEAFYRRFGLNWRQIDLLATATPKSDYYMVSPRGNRLFSLTLGPIALAFCGASTPDDQRLMDRFFDRLFDRAELRLGDTVVGVSKSGSSNWSRWFSSRLTSSPNHRGCTLCRGPDDHGDNDHSRSDHAPCGDALIMDNDKQPTTVDFALIERLGINRVADALDLSAGAVRRWRSWGVPKERHAAIAKLAQTEGQLAADHAGAGFQDQEIARLATRDNDPVCSTSDKSGTNDLHDHDSDAGPCVRLRLP